MEKIQLNSKLTFIKKYIISIWFISAGLFILLGFLLSKNWIGIIIFALVYNGIIYTARNFLFPLKTVFLDIENRKLLVKYKGKLVEVELSDILKIEEQSRIGKILNVKLNIKTKFGNEFIFVPKDGKVLYEILELKNRDIS